MVTGVVALIQMFEWATGVWLFEPDLLPSCSEEEAHLVQMTEALGEKIPMVMIEKGKHKDKYFGADGGSSFQPGLFEIAG